MNLNTLFKLAEEKAKREDDGHLTVMRFTTHWKVMGNTPNLDIDGRKEVQRLAPFETLEEALTAYVLGFNNKRKRVRVSRKEAN